MMAWVIGRSSRAPAVYTSIPITTYPSFERITKWAACRVARQVQGKQRAITLDLAAHSGEVNVKIDTTSVDLRSRQMNEHVKE